MLTNILLLCGIALGVTNVLQKSIQKVLQAAQIWIQEALLMHVCEENCIWFDAYGGCSECPYSDEVLEGLED